MIKKIVICLLIIFCTSLLIASISAETIVLHPFIRIGSDGSRYYGYMDDSGNIIIKPQYYKAKAFSEGLAEVIIEKEKDVFLSGYINQRGKMVIPVQYQAAGPFRNGLAMVSTKDKSFYIDKTGNRAITKDYMSINDFSEGYAAIQIEGPENTMFIFEEPEGEPQVKFSYIDTKGNLATTKKFDYANNFYNGYAVVHLNNIFGARGIIDKNFNLIVGYKYDKIGYYSEGLFPALKNEKWGYIDKTGKAVIPFTFKTVTLLADFEPYSYPAGSFSEGLAAVPNANSTTGFYGYIDKTGKYVIPSKYSEAEPFIKGLAAVKLKDKWGFIDKKGKFVIPAKYSGVTHYEDGFIKAYNSYFDDKAYYYFNSKGQPIKPKI